MGKKMVDEMENWGYVEDYHYYHHDSYDYYHCYYDQP